jgi:hypothetical protein
MMHEESIHWSHSERLTHYAGCVYSRHIRAAVIAAELRRTRGAGWLQLYLGRVWAWLNKQR